jgi:uncharacterized protein
VGIGTVVASAVTAVAVLSGCSIVVESDGSSAGTGDPAPATPALPDELQDDEQDAINATDGFWRTAFPEEFGRDYQPPIVAGAYIGENGPTCSGLRSVPFNAFYCPSEDFIAWDENLMVAGFEQIGDAWVYLIVAHEWAHAIQARLQRDQVSVAAELQADCLAGATLIGAARANLLTFEAGDDDELAQTLAAVADEFPWTRQSDHGNARERIGAFQAGLQGGVPACIA